MKAVTLILDVVHIILSAALIVLMPTVWDDASGCIVGRGSCQ